MSIFSAIKEMRFSETVQTLIWLLSLLGATFYFREIFRGVDSAWAQVAIFIFGLVSLSQQVVVYIDIHEIENNVDSLKLEYGNWINHWLEKSFRYLIFLSLLFGVGKLTQVRSIFGFPVKVK